MEQPPMSETPIHERRDRILRSVLLHRDALLTQAFVMLRDWAAAQDVVQEAFVVVVNKFEEFEEGTSVLAWARTIVRNKALEALRQRAREIPTEDERLETAVSAALDEQLTDELSESLRERRRALEECMSGLRQQVMEMLTGFYVRSETSEMLARTYNRSANSVRLLLSRARRDLRDCVERKMRTSLA